MRSHMHRGAAWLLGCSSLLAFGDVGSLLLFFRRAQVTALLGVWISAFFLVLGVLLLASTLRRAAPRGNRWLASAQAGLWAVAAYFSTTGPVISQSAWRWPLVGLGAALVGIAFAVVARLSSRWALALGGCAALALFLVDAFVLPRLYPAFHFALVVSAISLIGEFPFRFAYAGQQLTPGSARRSVLLALGALLVGTVAALYLSVPGLIISGKLWLFFPHQDLGSVEAARAPAFELKSEWSFRNRDVVLITIDALRADAVTSETMPNLRRWANEATEFTEAYTPTPNSSYALSSLHTGSWVHASALSDAKMARDTLAKQLSQSGYRTIAVYDRSVFSVDGETLAHYQREGFGFKHRFEAKGHFSGTCEFLSKKIDADERPLLFWTHVMDPHQPYEPRESRFGDSPYERYRAELFELDEALGRCLSWLAAREFAPVVVVSADHGEAFGEHRSYYHGSTLYEEQLKIPLLVTGPGVEKEKRTEAVSLVDVAPTLLAAMGLEPPATMLGHDLSRRVPSDVPRVIGVLNDAFAVRNGSDKAICDMRFNKCEYYDLADDPRETKPRMGGATWPAVPIERFVGHVVAHTREQVAHGKLAGAEAFGCGALSLTIRVANQRSEPLFRRTRALRSLESCPKEGEPLAIALLADGYMRVEAAKYLQAHGTQQSERALREQLRQERYLAGKQALSDALDALEKRLE